MKRIFYPVILGLLFLAFTTAIHADDTKYVNVVNTPLDVNVNNTPLQVELSNGGVFAREPFACSVGGVDTPMNCQIPPEKLLVIEVVNCGVNLPSAPDQTVLWLSLQYFDGSIVIPLFELGNSRVFIGSQQLRLYASPERLLTLDFLSNGPLETYDGYFSCHVSGYLIDPDSPSLAP